MTRVCIVGEVVNARTGGSGANVYFELRDADGAMPCAMWRNDFERSGMRPEELRDGVQVVAAGGPDYYVGGAKASPSFSFRVAGAAARRRGRPARAGSTALRRELAAEGLFEPQKLLAAAAAAALDRRRDRRGQRRAARLPRGARAALVARPDRLGLRAGAGQARRARDPHGDRATSRPPARST